MRTLVEYYRCPEEFASFNEAQSFSGDPGFFRFGAENVCFGRSTASATPAQVHAELADLAPEARVTGTTCTLPFDPAEVVDNLRYERYVNGRPKGAVRAGISKAAKKTYSLVRPMLSVSVRKHLQRAHLSGWKEIAFPSWPVDRTVDRIMEKLLALSLQTGRAEAIPFIWFWPEGHRACGIMTHDVETAEGRDFCLRLMDIDDRRKIKSAFQVIPEKRYEVTAEFLDSIRRRGFEINVHDLNHDGKLFADREQFLERAERINHYVREFGARGFRSGILYRNADWCQALDISYDMSFPTVGHLDAQRGGCCTVMPFFIGKILELPLTTTQDYSLFHILNDYSLGLWKQQIEMILEGHGLLSCIIHPDYIIEDRARHAYEALLEHLAELRAQGRLWMALPGEVDRWWRARNESRLVRSGDGWRIEGPAGAYGRIAWARLDGDKLVYSVEKDRAAGSQPAGAPIRTAGEKAHSHTSTAFAD